MRFKIALGVVFTSALFFAGCAKKGPPPFESGELKKNKAAVAKRYVKAERIDVLKKQGKKAFVPIFQVEFINQSSASSSSYSYSKNGSSSTHVTYKLEGVDTASFVALVDNLYADFQEKLKAEGFDVIPKETLIQSVHYQDLKSKAEQSNPVEKASRVGGANKALVIAPTDMAVVYLNSINPAPTLKNAWAALKGNLPEASVAHLIDSAGATAVCVQLVVGFAQMSDTHAWGSGNSEVTTNYRFAIAPIHSLIAFEGPESVVKAKSANRWNLTAKGSMFRLQKPMFGDNGWALGSRDITSTGSKVAEGVGNALSILAAASTGGGTSTTKNRVYALDVDKDKYLSLARDNLGYANDMMLAVATGAK